jgi:cell division transport system permease protein
MGIDRHFKARMRGSSVGTIVGVALVLFMLGALGFLLLAGRDMATWVRENVRVEVFMKHDVKEAEVLRFQKELDTQAFTKETNYVTADLAAEQMKKEYGEDFLNVLGYNPLLANIELKVNTAYAHPDSLSWIAEHLGQDARVEEVKYNKDTVANIDGTISKLGLVLLLFSALLLIIAVALIYNTIRLAIYSKRFLIRTMHLTGATQWFIKKPFLGQSLWQGLISSVLAIGLLVLTVRLLTRWVPDVQALIDPLLVAELLGGTVVLGLLISLVSTWFAVRRYLRMNTDELNWT